MIFVGDVHGAFAEYASRMNGISRSIQVGDMGIGFGEDDKYVRLIGQEHRFIRGNHDNPQKCLSLPQYLGDYGYLEDEEIFFVSGAFSVDGWARTAHVNWWADEELTTLKMDRAFDIYQEVKPKIVVTHDCPYSLYRRIYKRRRAHRSATATLFSQMFKVHHPRAWIFGHHHRSLRFEIGGTAFFGLAILEVINLEERGVGDEATNMHDGSSEVGKVDAGS
jgi:hypothetical protein